MPVSKTPTRTPAPFESFQYFSILHINMPQPVLSPIEKPIGATLYSNSSLGINCIFSDIIFLQMILFNIF